MAMWKDRTITTDAADERLHESTPAPHDLDTPHCLRHSEFFSVAYNPQIS